MNRERAPINYLNELLFDGHATYGYDPRGNRIFKKSNSKQHLFHYDPLNRLIAVETDTEKTQFLYDPLGRRLAKITQNAGTTHYLYDGEQEIGSFSNQLDTFRMLSTHSRPTHTLSIELANVPFVPITDIQGNIRRLTEIRSKNIAAHYDFRAFGKLLTANAPIHCKP